MTPSFSDFKLNRFFQHSTVVITILIGAVVDLLTFSLSTRTLGIAEAPAVILSIVTAAMFNFLILHRVFTSEKSTSKTFRSLGLYLVSVAILIVVRAVILKVFVETDLLRELIYFISMGVSFFINWLVLSWLFKVGTQAPDEGTR